MLVVELNSNAQEIARRVERFSDGMLGAIAKAMDKENDYTVGYIQHEKLNFSKDEPPRPDGLRHISRTLQKSVHATRAEAVGQSVQSAIGSNVVYARVHEFGYTGPQNVRPFRRANPRSNVYVPRKDGRGNTKRVAAVGVSFVRAFTRQANIPARAPFGNSLAERTDNYGEAVSAAIVNTWNEAAS